MNHHRVTWLDSCQFVHKQLRPTIHNCHAESSRAFCFETTTADARATLVICLNEFIPPMLNLIKIASLAVT